MYESSHPSGNVMFMPQENNMYNITYNFGRNYLLKMNIFKNGFCKITFGKSYFRITIIGGWHIFENFIRCIENDWLTW